MPRFATRPAPPGVRHFLEIFNPQFEVKCTDGVDFATYNNDAIAKVLAGVSRLDAPIFLKVVYNGPRATEELASYDPDRIIVGMLGGASSTTRDTLELVGQAEKYGARVALFGRKIFFAEDSVEIVKAMRLVIEEERLLRGSDQGLPRRARQGRHPLEEAARRRSRDHRSGAEAGRLRQCDGGSSRPAPGAPTTTR